MSRRSSSHREEAVDIMLSETELGEQERAPAADGGRVPDPSSAARRRRARLLALAALVVVVVVAAAITAVDARRNARRLAAVREIPGTTTSLAHPLREVWRVDGRLAGDLGDRVLVDAGVGGEVRAVDATTGRVEWTREPPGEGPELCRTGPADAGTAAVVFCVARAERGVETAGAAAVVSAVDVATGATLAAEALDGQVLDVGVVDGDAVVVGAEPDGRIAGVRWDPDSGRVLWRMTSRQRVVGTDGVLTEWSPRVVTVRGRAQTNVDLVRGQELPPQYVDDFRWLELRRHDLSGGRTLEWHDMPEDHPIQQALIRGADGKVVHSLDGLPWIPRVDDGSHGDLVLLLDPTARGRPLRAIDVATGEVQWSTPVRRPARPVLAVAGVLVSVEDGSAVGRDLDTGDVRWTQAVIPELDPVTDGDHVLLARGEAAPTLEARRLDDGTLAWSTEAPTGSSTVTTLSGGAVVAVAGEWIAGLG